LFWHSEVVTLQVNLQTPKIGGQKMTDNEKIKKGNELAEKIRKKSKEYAEEKFGNSADYILIGVFSSSGSLLSELFEWKETDTEGVMKLYYKSFWTSGLDQNAINNAPYISAWDDTKQYVEKGSSIDITFKTSLYGSCSVYAPETGVIEILVPCKFEKNFYQSLVQVPDESYILSLDYRKETVEKYLEQQEKERLEKERIEEEWEKKEIAKKILEKERKKKLHNEVLQELTEKGLITPK